MSKSPQTPRGVSTAYFGRYIMKWGRGERGAVARLATITAEELQAADVTCEILNDWYSFYRDEAQANPCNRAAAARAQLMTHGLRLLNCEISES
jgi:hypothetical protein